MFPKLYKPIQGAAEGIRFVNSLKSDSASTTRIDNDFGRHLPIGKTSTPAPPPTQIITHNMNNSSYTRTKISLTNKFIELNGKFCNCSGDIDQLQAQAGMTMVSDLMNQRRKFDSLKG